MQFATGTIAVGFVAALLAADAARADPDGTGVELRLRAVYLEPSSGALAYTTISGATTGEGSVEWWLDERFTVEVAVGAPAEYDLSSGGERLRIGPSTLTAKYSFAPSPAVRPYLGAGLHLTTLSVVNGGSDTIDSSRFGWVAQAGLEFELGERWYVGADLRHLFHLEPSGRLGGVPREAKIDPNLFGLGIAYRWR